MRDTNRAVSVKSLAPKESFNNGDSITSSTRGRHKSTQDRSASDLTAQTITESDEPTDYAMASRSSKPVFFINSAALLEAEDVESEAGTGSVLLGNDCLRTENLVTENISNNNDSLEDKNIISRN